MFGSGTDCIALYRVKGKTERNTDKYGEEHPHPRLFQSLLHIIGRASDERILPRILYSCASVDSMNALEAPSRAMTHIQKTAPGPPIAMAVATPAKFPVPTRLAMEMANA